MFSIHCPLSSFPWTWFCSLLSPGDRKHGNSATTCSHGRWIIVSISCNGSMSLTPGLTCTQSPPTWTSVHKFFSRLEGSRNTNLIALHRWFEILMITQSVFEILMITQIVWNTHDSAEQIASIVFVSKHWTCPSWGLSEFKDLGGLKFSRFSAK